MADEFTLTSTDDLTAVSSYVHDHFDNESKPLKVTITKKSNGTLPMLALWRMWVSDIAKFQADRGAVMPVSVPVADSEGVISQKVIGSRPYDEKDAHEAYTALCLGCDESGTRLSWAVNSDTHQGRKVASIGQKLHAMQKLHHFCLEHSIPIRMPERSEYQELQEKQND